MGLYEIALILADRAPHVKWKGIKAHVTCAAAVPMLYCKQYETGLSIKLLL